MSKFGKELPLDFDENENEELFEETRKKQMIGQANSSIFAATYLLMPNFVLQMK